MSTEIATPENTTALVINKKDLIADNADEKSLAKFGSSKTWLARIDLVGGNSSLAKEGKMGPGRYALVKDKTTFIDLGTSFNCMVLGLRLKATKFVDGQPTSYYDNNSQEFLDVVTQSGEQDSGCMAGPEFLLWIPNQKCFATFHMASKSQQNESVNVKALLGDSATLMTALVKPPKSRYSWHVTKTVACSINLTPPDMEDFQAQLQKFKNPPKPVVKEKAPESEENARAQ